MNNTANQKNMHFTKLVPNIFYKDIRSGLKTFVDCLEFTIGHQELMAAGLKEVMLTSYLEAYFEMNDV